MYVCTQLCIFYLIVYNRKIYILLEHSDTEMKRKIVQHGSSSMTVTLPIRWINKYNIKKGDEINMEESGPLVIISTAQETASPKKEVSTTESGIFTKNNLSHLYQLGYDEIEIRYDNNETLEEIKKRIPECMGFEIIDQKDHKVFIKSIATTIESEFDTLLRKAFLITSEMAKSMIEAFEKNDLKKLAEIRNMESINNKFTDICIRILNKRGYKVQNRTMQMYEIVKNIERIADEFKYICDLYRDSKTALRTELLRYFKEAVSYYIAFYEMFYKFNAELKRTIHDDRKKLISKYEEKLGESKGRDALFLHHLINIIQKTYDGAGGYYALSL